MNIVSYRLMGLAPRPQLPPLDVKSVVVMMGWHLSAIQHHLLSTQAASWEAGGQLREQGRECR